MRDLNRPEVDVFLLVGKANTAHGKPGDTEDDKENSDNGCSLHVCSLSTAYLIHGNACIRKPGESSHQIVALMAFMAARINEQGYSRTCLIRCRLHAGPFEAECNCFVFDALPS